MSSSLEPVAHCIRSG